jgi:bifunctional DNA-binding transcriptional regulator/antitoxin component of YhaV-PrlF toxin-antitoxin module
VVQDMGVPDDIDEGDIIDFIKDEHGEYILSRFNSEDDEEDDDDWEDDDWDNED